MILRVGIGAGLLLVAVIVAVVLERRRKDTSAPIRDTYPFPRQLHRGDFPQPEAPWLVVLFSSKTCDSCASMREKVLALASPEVAVCDVEFSESRSIHERYQISGVPMVLIADAEGVVRQSFVGPVSATDLWAAVAGIRAE
ncbi:MAG: thioredoxin family protein [Acidimicrobiia bacterium]